MDEHRGGDRGDDINIVWIDEKVDMTDDQINKMYDKLLKADMTEQEQIYQAAIKRLDEKVLATASYDTDGRDVLVMKDGLLEVVQAALATPKWIVLVTEHVSKVLNHSGRKQIYRSGAYVAAVKARLKQIKKSGFKLCGCRLPKAVRVRKPVIKSRVESTQ